MTEVDENILAESILGTDEVINIVIIEDDDGQIEIYKDAIDENNMDQDSIKINAVYLKNLELFNGDNKLTFQTNKPFIFTLIHKFNYETGKEYPILTERDDIFVLVD